MKVSSAVIIHEHRTNFGLSKGSRVTYGRCPNSWKNK